MEQPTSLAAQVGALRYIVVCLMQRLEATHPGLAAGLAAGVRGDRAAVVAQGGPVEVYDEAIEFWISSRR